VWKIFGRTLIVSHLAMLPFVIGIVYQGLKLARSLFSSKWYPLAGLIILIDPTLLAQSTLVSPDVLVVFFLLFAINSILNGKRFLLILSLAGLTLASMRGMMCAAALFISESVLLAFRSKTVTGSFIPAGVIKTLKDKLISYLPAAAIALAFFSWHYYKTGWIGHHENMPWAEFFEPADLKGAIFNVFILGWRLADFGRLLIWITGAFCLWHFLHHKPLLPDEFKMTLILFAVLLFILGGTLITHRNLSGHRYLLPVYLTFTISVLYYFFNIADDKLPKKLFSAVMITGLLSGNFWVYPDTVSKGWDSSLAYLPYFPLRENMMDYMNENNIKPDETGTGFPNEDSFDLIDLNGNNNSFSSKDLAASRYMFWSNIYNEFSDAELDSLKSWEKIKELKSCQVRIILYKNPYIKHP
jgi:hypothetical protein